jgi:hypothetical protein
VTFSHTDAGTDEAAWPRSHRPVGTLRCCCVRRGRRPARTRPLRRSLHLESTWLANTDADSRVPEDWLVRQLEFADAGWDVVLGSVEPDSAERNLSLGPAGASGIRWRKGTAMSRRQPWRVRLGIPAGRRTSPVALLRGSRPGGTPAPTRLCRYRHGQHPCDDFRTDCRAPHGFGAYLRALSVEAAAGLRSS